MDEEDLYILIQPFSNKCSGGVYTLSQLQVLMFRNWEYRLPIALSRKVRLFDDNDFCQITKNDEEEENMIKSILMTMACL